MAAIKHKLHKRAMKARVCAGAIDCAANDKSGKQQKNARAENDADNTMRND